MTAPTDPSLPFEHICEVCGTAENLTADAAHQAGWDYPPRMGEWGVISARTCGSCGITDTVWWALSAQGKNVAELTAGQRETIDRIRSEVPAGDDG